MGHWGRSYRLSAAVSQPTAQQPIPPTSSMSLWPWPSRRPVGSRAGCLIADSYTSLMAQPRRSPVKTPRGAKGGPGSAVGPGRPRNAEIGEAILAAARRHLASNGYESMSLVAIAEEAGTTRQALYRRWPTKADLATAAIASMSQADQRTPTADPYVDLVRELEAFHQGVTRPNGVSLVGTMLLAATDEELRMLFRERLVAPRRRRLRSILERAQEQSLIAEDADLDYAIAACTGVLYAQQLAGSRLGRTWARRTAALVWRACGGVVQSRSEME